MSTTTEPKPRYRPGTLAVHRIAVKPPTPPPTRGPCRSTRRRRTLSTVLEHAANLFGLRGLGNIYRRFMNPTNDASSAGSRRRRGVALGRDGVRPGRPDASRSRTFAQAEDSLVSPVGALRRHVHALPAHAAPASLSGQSPSTRTTRGRPPPPSTIRRARSTARRSAIPARRPDFEALAKASPTTRGPARHRQHVRDAAPLPPDRARGRTSSSTRHEVDRRLRAPRSVARSGRREVRTGG